MEYEVTNYEGISREGLIDMLEESEERLEEKSALIRDLKTRLGEAEQKYIKDRVAFGAALGDAVPAGYDGKLTDGTEPTNYIALHLRQGLSKDPIIGWIEHLMQSGSHDDCPTCNDIEAFLQRLEEAKL